MHTNTKGRWDRDVCMTVHGTGDCNAAGLLQVAQGRIGFTHKILSSSFFFFFLLSLD